MKTTFTDKQANAIQEIVLHALTSGLGKEVYKESVAKLQEAWGTEGNAAKNAEYAAFYTMGMVFLNNHWNEIENAIANI